MYEGNQHHREILHRLQEMFPDLGREAIYVYYTKLLTSLTSIDWPNEMERIKKEYDDLLGQTSAPYKREVAITYKNPERPGESIGLAVREGKLRIDIRQADDSDGEDFSVAIDPEDPNKSEFVCPECGEPQRRVPSGMVCKNGHGF